MKFKSRKDLLFTSVIYGLIGLLIGLFLLDYFKNGIALDEIWMYTVILSVIVLLLWLFHGTNYEITEGYFKSKTGPIRGEIEIIKITKIIKGKTLWVGLKPATATKGLIIKYEKYNEIYISPITNEAFIEQLLKVNPNITITSNQQ